MRNTATKRKAQNSVVRIASVMALPDIIRSLGADPNEVLAELGYDLKCSPTRKPGSPTQFATAFSPTAQRGPAARISDSWSVSTTGCIRSVWSDH